MGYINWLGRMFLCGCLAFVGCAGQDKKAESEAVLEAEAASADREKMVAMPNPYLSGDNKAPKAAEQAFMAAIATMQSEEWDLARQQLEQLTATYPKLSGPWVNLALVHRQQKHFEDAENAFKQALAVNSLNSDAYVQYAIMLREQGRFEEAEKIYLQALAVWPHNYEALINLGILYDMYMGRFDDALSQFELAQKIVTEPNRELAGWIIDLKRRQSK